MVAFKLFMTIALVMITINRPCSADKKQDCEDIIVQTFQDVVGITVQPDFKEQNLKTMYEHFTVEKIKKYFSQSSSSSSNGYSKKLKTKLLLDYMNKIYDYSTWARFLDYSIRRYPKDWCELQTANVMKIKDTKEFLADATPESLKSICMALLGQISIFEKTSTFVIFNTFYENWTPETLNYQTVNKIENPNLQDSKFLISRFCFERFVKNYYTYVKILLDTIDKYNKSCGKYKEYEVYFSSIKTFCNSFGPVILKQSNNETGSKS